MSDWILCERDPELKVIGIFGNQNQAEDAAIDGRYVLIPFNKNELYDDLISEGAVGAVFMQASGLNTQVEDNANDINNLRSAIQDLIVRVEALETP